MILAIDTSSAVTVMGTGSVRELGVRARLPGGRRHAEGIDLMFTEHITPVLPNPSDVQAIAVGIGPGPYSGLRVGIAFAIGLGRAWQVPVVGVCSLDARAWQVAARGSSPQDTISRFAVTADARRGEVYWASYSLHDQVERIDGPRVLREIPEQDTFADVEIDPAAMAHHVAVLLDSGAQTHEVSGTLVPHGENAEGFTLGPGPLFVPTPLYLRQPDITLPAGSVT